MTTATLHATPESKLALVSWFSSKRRWPPVLNGAAWTGVCYFDPYALVSIAPCAEMRGHWLCSFHRVGHLAPTRRALLASEAAAMAFLRRHVAEPKHWGWARLVEAVK